MKKYLDKNVYEAFCERINYLFDHFQCISFSVSGGKDSSVMVQLANRIAKERGRMFDVFFLDFEAQYKATIQHIYELKQLSQINQFHHYCLPLENEDNASSILRPTWIPWDEKERHLWVREMPEDAINIDTVPGQVFRSGQEWEDLLAQYPLWLRDKYGTDKVAIVVGIRADESFHRFRAVAFGKNLYNGQNWTTKIKKGVYNCYPLYDWRTEDIWHAVSRFDLKYNAVYEMLWKNGISIHEQRICHPYGADQRTSLNQWAKLEPDTWHKVVNRVSGANFGNIYAKTTLLGHHGSEKPDYMSWEQYAVFLLESIGLYSPELRDHYVRKIKILFEYIREEAAMKVDDISEEHHHGPDIKLEEWVSWKRIARTIEKNDFPCRGLQYGLTLKDRETMKNLKEKWGKLLGIQTNTKEMRELQKDLANEEN